MKQVKEERWVIDFEKSDLIKLRSNQEPNQVQSEPFNSKAEASRQFKKVLNKKLKNLIKESEFIKQELDYCNSTLSKLEDIVSEE